MSLLSYFGEAIVRFFIVAQVTVRECSISIKISFIFFFRSSVIYGVKFNIFLKLNCSWFFPVLGKQPTMSDSSLPLHLLSKVSIIGRDKSIDLPPYYSPSVSLSNAVHPSQNAPGSNGSRYCVQNSSTASSSDPSNSPSSPSSAAFNTLYVPTSYPAMPMLGAGNSSPYSLSYQSPPTTQRQLSAAVNPTPGYWASPPPSAEATPYPGYPPTAQIQNYSGAFASWADTSGSIGDYHRSSCLPSFPTYVPNDLRSPWSNYNHPTFTGQYARTGLSQNCPV